MSATLGDNAIHARQYRDFRADTDEVMLRRPQEGKNLELTINGEQYKIGRIASAFPLSSVLDTVAFFNPDGEEIGCMKEGSDLDAESRDLLREELDKAYFMPRIRAILAMEEYLGIETWRVMTNKGEREFQVRDPRHSVRHLPHDRVLIKDVDGNRYEVRRWRELDRRSIYLLMRHL